MTKVSTIFANVYFCLMALTGFIMLYKLQKDYASKKRHMFIASSFFINELPSNRTLIRTLAVVEKSLFDPKLICEVDGRFAPARVRRLELFVGCKWGSFFIECPAQQTPKNFYIRGENSRKHEVQITKPETKKRGFVVCFSRMFFFERWQAALTAIQIYKFHGIDLMVVPIISVIKEMFELLRAYEEDGIVRLKRAAMIPNIEDLGYNPNSEVDWFLQVLNFDECLYEYRESADFVAFADLDDIMIPRHSTNLHTELMELSQANPQLASFEFNWQWSSAIISPEPSAFNLDAVINSIYVQFNAPKCGKPVVIPKRVQEGFIHHPEYLTMRNELLPGYKHKWFRDENTPVVIHLRHIFSSPHVSHPNSTNTFFGSDPRYQFVQQDFQDFLQRHPSAYQAFQNLPTAMTYYDATHKCLKETQFQRCHSAIICSPEESPDLPDCMVLKNDVKSTLVSNNWEIYSSGNDRFVHKSNCLL